MTNLASLQTASLDLLKYLKTKKELILARHTVELTDIDKEIEAVSITVRLLREAEGVNGAPAEALGRAVIPEELSGMSIRAACIAIAQRNNGVVRISDAKKALVSAQILREGKNTWGVIYTTLHRSKEFEKTHGAGEFKLLTFATEQGTQRSLLQ
jgi:hypothetical protein